MMKQWKVSFEFVFENINTKFEENYELSKNVNAFMSVQNILLRNNPRNIMLFNI